MKEGLRPTLSDALDAEFKALICDCWNPEPALRPSFSVVRIRLEGIVTNVTDSGRQVFRKDMISGARATCRALNELLWDYTPGQWDDERAASLIDKDAIVTARDPTLQQILRSELGPSSAKAMGRIMFGGFEDGTEIRPEPVLDTDIVISQDGSYALLKTRFAVVAQGKIKQWRVNDTREFDGLQAALLKSEETISSWGTEALEKGVAAEGVGKRKKLRSARIVRKKRGGRKNKKDARLEKFIKAARFVRGYGAATIHPSAKIEFYGLRMQALKGDCPEGEEESTGIESSASSVRQVQLQAWRSLRGKGQEAAMEEYLSKLTSLAPNWKVAHIVLGRQSEAERRKPRKMMLVLSLFLSFSLCLFHSLSSMSPTNTLI